MSGRHLRRLKTPCEGSPKVNAARVQQYADTKQWADAAGPKEHCGTPDGERPTCLNSGQPVRTAIRRCLLIRSKRAFAATNALSAPGASKGCSKTSARTAAVDLSPDQSDQRRTGEAITSLARTPRVPESDTDRSIRSSMHASRRPSGPYRLTNDKTATMVPAKELEWDTPVDCMPGANPQHPRPPRNTPVRLVTFSSPYRFLVHMLRS